MEKRSCSRCARQIDAHARICPFCNQDQNEPVQPVVVPPAVEEYRPPEERNFKRYALIAAAFVAMLVASFYVGSLINRDDAAPEDAPEPVTAAEAEAVSRPRRADTPLVPVEGPIERPITTAPVADPTEGVPAEYERSDATAVSAAEYARLAERAQAEQARQPGFVDPRALTGAAYAQGRPVESRPAAPRQPQTAEQQQQQEQQQAQQQQAQARRGARTKPVPQSTPLPRISVSQPTTARLDLIVGADGRVKQVNVRDTVPGQTARIIAAVQSWRFRPATENGVPVPAEFSVDISFGRND